MKEFFAKYGGKYKDPYEAIELICHKLYEVKDKVAKADPSHIKDLSSISDMIDDYVNSIKDDDLKPVQIGHEYQDHPRQKNTEGIDYRHDRDDYRPHPMYRNEYQRNDPRTYEHARNSSRDYVNRDFDGNYPDDSQSRRSGQSDNPGRHYRDGFSNPRR